MLMFYVEVNMKRLGVGVKNVLFQWFRVDSFFWETNFIHGALSDLTFLQDVFINLELRER